MDSKLIMENYLLILKSTVEVFVHGTLESSNNIIRESLKNGLDTIMASQAKTYQEMVNNGWYQVNNVEITEINKTLNKLQSQN